MRIPGSFNEGWADSFNGNFGFKPESTGPIPPAPSFPGMSFAQFIPANLVIDGTLALNDPIDSLPLYGDLIPGGAFTAAGSARPIVADDGTGRVGMQMDGVDDMPTITGLSLDLTGGFTFYAVFKVFAGWELFAGVLRADAGSDSATSSVAECYTATTSGPTDRVLITRRLGVTATAQSAGVNRSNILSVGGIWDSGAERGIYLDGALSGTGSITNPSAAIQRIQIAGYDRAKFNGFAYTWIIYNGVHNAAQRLTVRDYLRAKFNGGSAF